MSFQTAGLSSQSLTEENNLKTNCTASTEETPPTSVTETPVTPDVPAQPVAVKREGRKVSSLFI